jgi:endo-1,4-beta-mannosidase
MANFLLGVNYWDSVSGTDMWKNWSEEVVYNDLKALSENGVRHLRVFPNWRDFQPVKKLYGWSNTFREYAFGDNEDYLPYGADGVDPVMIERFKTFAKIADSFNMTLTVSILTGWMSGRMFAPPAFDGRNLITDPEVRVWTNRYVKAIVTAFKDIKNVVMWDVGNECNCLQMLSNRYEAYSWMAFMVNTIKSIDNTRPVASGMHGLSVNDGIWNITDQGELADLLTTHPYPSPTVLADREPYNSLRTSIIPTLQSEYYSAIGKKPCMIQEQGTFSTTIGNNQMSGDFLRVNVLSAYANNLKGYLWWCGMEHLDLQKAPYGWSMIERELGLLFKDRTPKPVGIEMKKLSSVMQNLPDLSDKQIDAVCVLPRGDNFKMATSAYIFAKQVGFNISFDIADTIPKKSQNYILPAISGWEVTFRRTYDYLLDRVISDGANLLITYDGGQLTEFDRVTGLKSLGMKLGSTHTATFNGASITYKNSKELLLNATTATVLVKDETDNPVLTVNNLGKGKVYFCNFAPEFVANDTLYGYNPDKSQSFYKVYEQVFGDLKNNYILNSDNPYIGVTQSKCDDGYIVTAINYSDKPQKFDCNANIDYNVTVLYGDTSKDIPACDALILKLINK